MGALLASDPGGLERLLARCRIVNVNEKAVRIFGGTADRLKLIARPILDFWPSQCRPMLVELLAMVLAQQSWRITQTRAMHSDGPLRNASAAAWRSLDQSRANTIYLMISGILSDDRPARELHAGEDRYRKLIHHMPTALWQVDARASRGGGVRDADRHGGTGDRFGRLGSRGAIAGARHSGTCIPVAEGPDGEHRRLDRDGAGTRRVDDRRHRCDLR